jgi:hypothetical protein
MGNHYAVRLQRAVIQEWKQDVPWAKAGQATVANGGDIAKEAGLFPAPALAAGVAGAAPTVAAAPAAPAAAAPAPAAPAGAPAPGGGITLKPGQIPPYDTPIAFDNIQPGRVNVIQTLKSRLGAGDRVVGLVRNDSGGPIYNLRIFVTGSDAKGNTSPRLQTTGKTYLAYMQPGEVQPFEAQGSLIEALTYNVSTQSTPGTGLPAYRDIQPKISGQHRNERGWLVVDGTVTNGTSGWRRNANVIVSGWDASNNLLDVASGFTNPPDLAPGQSATFTVTMPGSTANVKDVKVNAEAYDKSLEVTEPVTTDRGGSNAP